MATYLRGSWISARRMDVKSPEEFMRMYEKAANSGNFDKVAPLLSDEAIFWFSDGSYSGIENIRTAFEKT